MTDIRQTIGKTSPTLVDILRGPDCPERRERVAELVRIYQPVWEQVAKMALLRHGGSSNATLDAEDVACDAVAKMLAPEDGYFRTHDPSRGSMRGWIKSCIRSRVIDLLRRRGAGSRIEKGLAQKGRADSVDALADVREMYELIREALCIADRLCTERGRAEDMEIFRAKRSVSGKLGEEERRRKGWTEWAERTAVSRVWDLIRDEAIPQAAVKVADDPQEAIVLAQEIWDKLKNRKALDFPE